MNEQDQKLLEQAVINLTLENAKLKTEVAASKTNESMWYENYVKARNKVEELQENQGKQEPVTE